MKDRIWVVSELYYPEQTSSGYFLTHIAEGLAADYDVCVVSGQPSYSERGIRAPRYEERNGAHINRVRSSHFDKDRLALRAVNLVSFTLSVFWFALRRFREGDKLLVVTNPPTLAILLGLVARWRRCKSVFLVHDVYPEFLFATKVLRPDSWIARVLGRVSAWTYRLYDEVVVLGRDMKEVVGRKLGERREQIEIIPNWGDVDEIVPIRPEDNAFRREHGLDGSFVVQFSGNIGRSHDVEMLLDAARSLRDEPRIRFLFVGYGGKSSLVQEARRAGLDNVLFLPRQPRERLAEMLCSSDATVISFVDGMYGLSVPSRMYNVMAAGVPIIAIAHPQAELSLTVAEGGAGWVVEPRTSEALVTLLRRLATVEGTAEARSRGAAGRALAESQFTLASVLESYRAVFARL